MYGKWSKDLELLNKLKTAVAESTTKAQVLRKLGLRVAGANYKGLEYACQQLSISMAHFVPHKPEHTSHLRNFHALPLNQVLVKGRPANSFRLGRRLVKLGLLKDVCAICNNKDWLGKPLSLHLDHIDGDRLNNTIENLRLLCPNCHSQTPTYCGRNIKKAVKAVKPIKTPKTRMRPTKIQWPTPEDMQRMLWETSTLKLAIQLGVSDVAIAKFVKKHSLTKPPRGYWAKRGSTGN